MTMHDTRLNDPCSRCGLKKTQKTAYIPCLEEGDTLETWVARHRSALIAAEGFVPDLLLGMATFREGEFVRVVGGPRCGGTGKVDFVDYRRTRVLVDLGEGRNGEGRNGGLAWIRLEDLHR